MNRLLLPVVAAALLAGSAAADHTGLAGWFRLQGDAAAQTRVGIEVGVQPASRLDATETGRLGAGLARIESIRVSLFHAGEVERFVLPATATPGVFAGTIQFGRPGRYFLSTSLFDPDGRSLYSWNDLRVTSDSGLRAGQLVPISFSVAGALTPAGQRFQWLGPVAYLAITLMIAGAIWAIAWALGRLEADAAQAA